VGHPEVSPNLSPRISSLKAANIKVHGIVGTADVLAPDALVFKELCEKYGVQGEWLVWNGRSISSGSRSNLLTMYLDQMHCFPLAWVYGLSEGKVGKDWILDVLKRHVGTDVVTS
jgi:hypothetical protein